MIKKLLLVILFFTATHSFSRNLTENHLPTELYGEWYNPENGDLLFGFYNNNAVYNEQVWRYNCIEKKGKDVFINIALLI